MEAKLASTEGLSFELEQQIKFQWTGTRPWTTPFKRMAPSGADECRLFKMNGACPSGDHCPLVIISISTFSRIVRPLLLQNSYVHAMVASILGEFFFK
jgi:hypothetical protein